MFVGIYLDVFFDPKGDFKHEGAPVISPTLFVGGFV